MLDLDHPVVLKTGCKINLYLEILSRRADGYHELRTLLHPLPEPSDRMEIRPGRPSNGPVFSCNRKELETPSNLVVKTFKAYGRATGFWPDIQIHLIKHIPVGAGLGGGSSDAAALLLWLNRYAGYRALPEHDLGALAASLGADVPFFLSGRPAWGTGIGDLLEPADTDLSGYHVLLACPPVAVSTAWAYRAWDLHGQAQPPPTGAGNFLTEKNRENIRSGLSGVLRLYNSFESVVYPAHPELRALKEQCLSLGAVGALLTGSGAAVFGLFGDAQMAQQAAAVLGKNGTAVFVHCL